MTWPSNRAEVLGSGIQPETFDKTSSQRFCWTSSPERDCWWSFSLTHTPGSECGGEIGVALFISPAITLVSLTERVAVVIYDAKCTTKGTPPGKEEHPPGRAFKSVNAQKQVDFFSLIKGLSENEMRAAGMVWAQIKCHRSGLRCSKRLFHCSAIA